jgi:hypothetical protein
MPIPFPIPSPPSTSVPSTAQLVCDAVLALNYCTTNGVTVDQQIVSDITNVATALGSSVPVTLNASTYASVARLEDIKTRIDVSIRASQGWDLQRKLSLPEKLLFSRFFQSYSSMTQALFLAIAVTVTLILYQAQSNLYLGRSLYASLESITNANAVKSPEETLPVPPPDGSAPVQDVSGENKAAYNANNQLLERWTKEFDLPPLNWLIPSFLLQTKPEVEKLKESPTKGKSSGEPNLITEDQPQPAPVASPLSEKISEDEERFPVYQFLIDLLNSYICPCLGGILGSTVYVLRMINLRSIKHDLSDRCNSTYLVRLFLGGIFGVVITWFTGAGAPDSWKSLPPLALSFVTGYNIEIVFTAMDKLIATFSPSSPSTLQENHPRG